MRRAARGAFALSLLLAASPSPAETPKRPRVGLVLSGGSAHGFAHVGVLKVLEELRVPVDVVAGTSMGSIVGGLYASGMSPAEMERLLLTTDWEDLLDDRPSRDRLSYRRKQDDVLNYVDLEMGLTKKGIAFPSGLVAGQKLSFLLKSLTLGTVGVESFDALPIPFRCVATDITTGEKVVLSDGSLAEAIRASMSLPAVFSPVPRGSRLLVDGGLVENLPVAEAEAMGAQVVVAVDVSSDKLDPEKLLSFGGVLSRTISLPIRQNVSAALLRASVVVRPRVGDIPSMDFARAADLVARGEAAGRALAKELSALSVTEEEYSAFRERVRGRRPESPVVDAIQTVSAGVDTRQITSRLETRVGSPLDVAVLRRDLDRIYEMGVFETVDFRLLRDEGRNVLLIDARPKSWGPTFLRVGGAFEANFDGNATLALRATLHSMQLNGRGGELKTTIELGTVPGANLEYYQPLDYRGRFFVSASVLYQRSLARVSVPGGPVGEAQVSVLQAAFDGGVSLGSYGQIHAGVFRGTGGADIVLAEAPQEDLSFDHGGLFGYVGYDTLDDLAFPRRGTLAAGRLEAFREDMGSDSSFYRLFARGVQVLPLGARTTVIGSAGWEDTLGSDPPYYMLFTLADFSRVSALSRENVAGERAASLSASVSHRIASLPTRIGRGVYVGGTFELARVWTRREETSLSGLRPAGGIYAGADTVLGPIYAGIVSGYGGSTNFFVFLGRPF
ncbi:MAG: patatin-like phospholipase family protein [Holophagales bacterium]|nr:patatin-like phospholipase family protein [Holophagales bacterium]